MMVQLLNAMKNRRIRREQAQLEKMRQERDDARRKAKLLTDRLLVEMDDNEKLRRSYGALVRARLRDAGLGCIASSWDLAA